jgi:hypothetical protein
MQNYKEFLYKYVSKLLCGIVDAPWYIQNDNLHKDLDMETVDSVIRKYAQSH